MKHADAAALLGIPESEVSDVFPEDAGTVIVTTDGQAYISVPADAPDADGKTGLMFLAAPSASYAGGFPVFAQPTEADDTAETEQGEGEGEQQEEPKVPAGKPAARSKAARKAAPGAGA